MIENINIRNTASYDDAGVSISNLKAVNFIYGSNGSGKTTISKMISKEAEFADCSVLWTRNAKMSPLVYNKEFINENFHSRDELQGIFTLGKESLDILAKIEEQGKVTEVLTAEIAALSDNTKKSKELIINQESMYKEICWGLKTKYDIQFQAAFQGLRNSKDRFTDECKNKQIFQAMC